jgi:hypothetical protein
LSLGTNDVTQYRNDTEQIIVKGWHFVLP